MAFVMPASSSARRASSTPAWVTKPRVVDSTRSMPSAFAVLAAGIGAMPSWARITSGQMSPFSTGAAASDRFRVPTSTAPATNCVASSPPPLNGRYVGIGTPRRCAQRNTVMWSIVPVCVPPNFSLSPFFMPATKSSGVLYGLVLQLTIRICGSFVPRARGDMSSTFSLVFPLAIVIACPTVNVRMVLPSAGRVMK